MKDNNLARHEAGMNPSADLEAIVGKGPISQKEACDKLWGYIEKNRLRDPDGESSIIADEKLRRVFGGRPTISEGDMPNLVSAHLS